MSTAHRITFTPNLVLGIGIMLVGFVLTLDRFGVVEAHTLLRFWPVMLILFGASIVMQAFRGVAASPSDSGPAQPIITAPLVILIVIGFLFVSHVQRRQETAARSGSAETVSLLALMGRDDRATAARRFRGGDMTSFMGQTRLDLRQAMLAPGEEAVIDVFALMGGAVIHVPREWMLDVQTVQVMGGVKDERVRVVRQDEADQPRPGDLERSAPPLEERAPPRVVLRGFIMMGGLIIRS